MTLLDRYVWRIVLGAFAAGQLFFLFLTVLVDLLNGLAKYAERAAGRGLGNFDLAVALASYYAKMVPVFFTMVTPFVAVVAGMFTVARLQSANEVVAMLFVGRSIRRILRPVLLCGALAGAAMGACWQWVVPQFGASLARDEAFLKEGRPVHKNLVHEMFSRDGVSEELRLQIAEFEPGTNTMRGIRMLTESLTGLDNTSVSADEAVWDEQRRDWRLTKGEIASQRGSRPLEWLDRSDLTPEVLVQRSRDAIVPDTLSYTELLELVRTRPNRPDFRYALHRHITYPLSCVLLLLLALPLAVNYERRSRLFRLLVAIGLCGGYSLVDLICQNLGLRGLHPVVAAWSPVIVFGSLGVVLFGGTRT